MDDIVLLFHRHYYVCDYYFLFWGQSFLNIWNHSLLSRLTKLSRLAFLTYATFAEEGSKTSITSLSSPSSCLLFPSTISDPSLFRCWYCNVDWIFAWSTAMLAAGVRMILWILLGVLHFTHTRPSCYLWNSHSSGMWSVKWMWLMCDYIVL